MLIDVRGETAADLRRRRGLQGSGVLAVRTYSGRIDVGDSLMWVRHPRHGWVEAPASYEGEALVSLDPDADASCRRLSEREKGEIEIVG